MTIRELKDLINTGEKIDIEFKESENNLNKDIYETVCSFNNRNNFYYYYINSIVYAYNSTFHKHNNCNTICKYFYHCYVMFWI